MAITEVYVDPAIAANTGTGVIGDPYGDLQFALDSVTRDSTNGNRFNIKAGADEVLAGTLSVATYGTPTFQAPLIFQGYTSSAGDGGEGGISGNALVAIWSSSTVDFVSFIDLHLHNTGSSVIIGGDDNIMVIRCRLDNTTNNAIGGDLYLTVLGCSITNIGGTGVELESGVVAYNYFANGANDFDECLTKVSDTGNETFIEHNIFSVDGSSHIINANAADSERLSISHNSFYTTGTGNGIVFAAGASGACFNITNNLFEGLTVGIVLGAATEGMTFIGANSFYDCTDNTTGGGKITLQNNESLGATPFAKSGADSYANRADYFAPVDTGDVLSPLGGMGGARGAVQYSSAGGGGGIIINPGMVGGLRG